MIKPHEDAEKLYVYHRNSAHMMGQSCMMSYACLTVIK